MPLDACIAKVGTVSENDAAFLRKALDDGATELEAMNMLEATIQEEVRQITSLVEQAGGKVRLETDDVRSEEQMAEDRKWSRWKSEMTSTGKIKGAPDWVNEAADPRKAEQQMEREVFARINEGLTGRYWYEESTQRILDIVQGDLVEAEKFIQLIAIYSPQATVQVNTGMAVTAYNQWKRGEQIQVKTGEQNRKAENVLYYDKPFEGRKTDSFYQNLMYDLVKAHPESLDQLSLDRELIESLDKPATIDMWMVRAFGYPTDAVANDKGSGKYSYTENFVRKFTAKLNNKLEAGQDRWTPHQVQAAVWSAMKARYELPEIKLATNLESVEKGYSRKKGGSFERVDKKVATTRAHLAIWRKHAMKVTKAKATEAAERSSASFETFIDQMIEVVTWESMPSTALGLDINQADQVEKRQFMREALQVIVDEQGTDQLAGMLGIPINFINTGLGAYEGNVNDNALTHLLPEKLKGGKGFDREKVRLYAQAIQYIYKQDLVPWFRADPTALAQTVEARKERKFKIFKDGKLARKSKKVSKNIFDTQAEAEAMVESLGPDYNVQGGKYSTAVALQFDRKLSPEDADSVLHLLESVFGDKAGFTKTASNEISVINFRDDETQVPMFMTDEIFDEGMNTIGPRLRLMGLTEMVDFYTEGEGGYYHDWQEDPTGKAVLSQEGISGRSDLQAWVRGRRKAFDQVLDRYQGEELAKRRVESQATNYLAQSGPDTPAISLQPFDTAFDHEMVPITSLRGMEGAHAADRATKFLQETLEGKRDYRRPPAGRRNADGTVTVLDGRSGTMAAIAMGYTDLPIRIIDDVRDKETGEVVEVSPELDEHYVKAARAKDKLDKPMEAIAARIGGGVWKDTALKGRGRAQWKVDNEYDGDVSRLKDLNRGTLSVRSIQEANDAMSMVIEHFGFRNMIKQKANLDQFLQTNFDGYKDINLVFMVEGVPVEIQINARANVLAKHFGHDLYEAYREVNEATPEGLAKVKALVAIEQKLYRDSYRLSKDPDTTLEQAMKAVRLRIKDVEAVNAQYGLSLNFSKSDLESLAPLWAAEATGNFRGGSVSHAKQALSMSVASRSSVTGTPSTSSMVADGGSVSTVSIDSTSTDIVSQRQGERGKYFPNLSGKRVIQLTSASDLSTFLHESGHLFLDVQRMWAEKYGMSDNQREMLRFLGVGSFDQITDEEHETWAETFEAYLREGKAPSIGLRRAFASFTSWLTRLYRSLSDPRLGRAKLSPEVTQIFDRMLATQEEIEMAELQPEYAAMFKSQEQAGMTDVQWQKYLQSGYNRTLNATATVQQKVLAQYKQQTSAAWRKEKAPLIAQEKIRLATEKVYQLMSDMTVIKDDAGEVVADGRVDWHALREAIGEWPNGKNWIGKAVGGGMDPGLYADQYGYPSVKAMYEDVKASPTLKAAAEQAAEQQMIEKHGDILNDGTLETEVREAMLNDDQAKMVLAELKSENRPRSKGIDRAALKHQAELLIGTMTFKQIRPSKYYNQMVKAAQAAGKAKDPTEDKIQQLANHYLYKAAMDAKAKMTKDRKAVRNVQARILAGKVSPLKVDQEYIEAMANLAMSYDMRLTPTERAAKAKQVLDFYQGQITPYNEETGQGNEKADLIGLEMLDPNVVAAIRYRSENQTLEGFELKTFDQMTVDEIDGVVEMIKHLGYVGRQVANEGSLEAAALREAGKEAIEAEGGKDFPVKRGKVREGKMAKLTWGDFWSSMASLSNMVRKLDGFKDGGWAFENILKPIHAAIDVKMNMQLEMFREMEGFMAQMPVVGLRLDDATDFTKEDGTVDDFSSSEVFMMAIYWGTESSREALMQGHNLTENDVHALMARLTPDQLALVNQVWEMNESQWPALQAAAKEMLGVAPPKLAATPFTVNGVQMTGGHMQLMYDSQALELADESMRGMNTSNVVPMRQGSTHARRGSGGRPILLDTQNITQSMEEKTHYIAFAKVGRHLRGILNNKEIQNTIEKKHGAPYYENLLHSITAITRAEPAKESSRWAGRLNRWMRKNATLMHLGYSLRNVMQQFPAAFIAAREVGPIKFAQASAMFGANPLKMRDEINAKSAKMMNRGQLINRDSREAMKKILATTKTRKNWEKVKGAAFVLQTTVDMTVAYPTWYAKYNDSMEKHGDEARAIIEADQAVGETVGSGHDAFLGRIMQSNQSEFVKTLTIFGSWFNAYYQRLYKASKGGTSFLNPAMLMDAIVMPIIVANLTQMIIGDWPDEDEDWWEYGTKNSLKFMIATLPVLREGASFYEGFTPTTPTSAVPASIFRIGQEVKSTVKGKQSVLKGMADIGRATGTLVPMPGSGNIWRLMDYTASFIEGKEGKFFNPYLALTEGADKDR